jgi:hypothetical protein
LPFGHRHSLLGSSCTRRGVQPSSRSAHQTTNFFVWTSTGLSRSARDRYDRGGCPLYPGDGGALPPGQMPPGGTRRLPAAGPYLPLKLPIGGSANDEASTRLHAIHPSDLPQPVAPGWNGNPWALHPGLRTPRSPTTHAEAGTVPAHWTGHYTIDISRPSFDVYRCTRATSCRTAWFSQEACTGVWIMMVLGCAVRSRSMAARPR